MERDEGLEATAEHEGRTEDGLGDAAAKKDDPDFIDSESDL